MMTVSMTWIRPFEHLMSVLITFAVSPMVITWSTFPTLTPRGWPFTVSNVEPVRPVTWRFRRVVLDSRLEWRNHQGLKFQLSVLQHFAYLLAAKCAGCNVEGKDGCKFRDVG